MLHKSGVYNIPCNNYNLSYIDQTYYLLVKTINEHKDYVKNQKLFKFPIARHSWKNNHVFNLSDTKVIHNQQSPYPCKRNAVFFSF